MSLALGVLAAPLGGDAQPPPKIPRIGYLGNTSPSAGARTLESFRQGLRELGYVEGQSIFIDYRWTEGTPDQFAPLAAELIQLRADVIVTFGNLAVAALQQATRTVPIVGAVMGDPVGSGFVASLGRPGGNITGFSLQVDALGGKSVALLKEAAPKLSRVAVLAGPQNPTHQIIWREIQVTAQALKVSPQRLELSRPDEIEPAFASLIKARAQGLIVLPQAVATAHRKQIVGLAAKNRLPGMYPDRLYAEARGFLSYGADYLELSRRAARLVDRILKGARPADLPVEQPTKFELVINLKTAKALGLTIPPSFLQPADDVIK
jgi:ABC-type uncharacterized transport system substrate-binding protein